MVKWMVYGFPLIIRFLLEFAVARNLVPPIDRTDIDASSVAADRSVRFI
jgi:hypothetical protein